ncbi:axotactin-like isoform X2 [Mya arenaria]|uniref:axotactin-like isoform X2 n=1 Tax=Mya arenaria TaxID=6604 RepID=UPI0022E6D4D7|nr:axotactin-like isoform X2 [Mya arenaria]
MEDGLRNMKNSARTVSHFRGAKFLHSLKLAVFLVIVAMATIVSSQEIQTSWTFNIPDISFISFSPKYTNTQNQRISLNFRTRNPNGLIFCHYLKDLDVKELKRINYQLCAELQYGVFVLKYQLMQYSDDGISIGKALNNNQWHHLEVFIDVSSGELTVKVDNETTVTSLKSYTRQEFTTLLDWTQHSSAIYFGGTDPDTLFSDTYPHFLGCMSDIQYETSDSKLVPVPVTMMEGVDQGCTDRCTNNPCHHGGSCINGYDQAVCDCFGTDYEGEFCSVLGPTTVTLRGYEWLTYSLHPYDKNILAESMRLSLEFKTSRGSGVLFYAVGGAPYHSHVTASVHAGKILVSVAIGDDDIEVEAGIAIDDYRWHNLTIVHEVRKVYVYLDGQENERDILDTNYHLTLDPKIFIGGGNNFVVTRGLQVTQNFVGCFKNIYINDVSVLYEMAKGSNRVKYNGGGSMQPHYSCKEVVNIPISFPTAASMLTLDSTNDMKDDFEIEFDFKTVRSEAVLLYLSLQDTDTAFEYNFGFVEVWIKAGQPHLKFVPSNLHPERTQNYTIPNLVNTNIWHSMHLAIKQGEAKLKVNGNSVSTSNTKRPLEIYSQIIVGYGYNSYKAHEGYVGCIRNLKINGQTMDALDLVQTSAASGLIIDGCNITDYCKGSRMCEHGGVCLSEWTDVACDCSETFYTGLACHFPKYKKTCDEYYQSGVNESGVMLVDLDGSGDLDPVHVRCHMGFEERYDFFGQTIVDHNFPSNTTVRASMMRDLKRLISYRLLGREELIRLTQESAFCRQKITYNCIHSTIDLGTKTWFKSASSELLDYIGTDNTSPGSCPCSLTASCTGEMCNCDNNTMTLQKDEGYNTVKHQLPITEVTILQDENPLTPGSANLTLGPLVCWGNSAQIPSTAVTFSSGSGYLISAPWKTGDIKVSFRTHHDTAIILYQTGTKSNINYFIVAVTSENTVKFYFRWGMKFLEVDIESPEPVSNGEWHQVSIETDVHNIRCMLDMTEKILDIPDNVPRIPLFSGILYVGGVPDTLKKDTVVADVVSIVGCMRGLAYNGKPVALSDLIDSSTQNVYKECMASCWPNPCRNGGKCLEKWGAHQCVCVNKWAHSGHNCEIDINTDAVTFQGTSTSYLHYILPVDSGLLDSTIIFNFRTFLRNTLLLYIHDHLNNFVLVQLQDSNKIIAKFNRYNLILQQTRQIDGYLDDGSWNQVVIDNADGYIKVIVNVDDEPSRNSYKKQSLDTYMQVPFTEEELVKPVRGSTVGEPGIHLYVGGVPLNMSTYTSMYGCIRGLKIGDTVFQLQKEAEKSDENVSHVCLDGCESSPCRNGGVCEEQWQDRRYTCDCAFSEYAGPTCNTEASGYFQGESILQYKYTPPKEALETRTERLELVFRVNPGATENMVLVFIYSERETRYWTHDFIIVYLDPHHGIYLNTNQGYSIHGVGKEGLFADGRPHQLLYRRNQGEMILTVRSENHRLFRNKTLSLDEEGIGRVTVSDNALDELDTIMIGGILNSQFGSIQDTDDYRDYLNFTGCMSEVTFYPVGDLPFALRPLKDLRDNQNSTGIATAYGPEIQGCSTKDAMAITTSTQPLTQKPSTLSPQLTFPPWNPGPAKTEYLGPPPTLPINKTSPAHTSMTTPSNSVSTARDISVGSHGRDKHDNKVIAIALCVVGFLLLVAIMVACVLVRLRRREEEKEKENAEKNQDIELKQPLNDVEEAISENRQNQNYLARLDEFSMVSAQLGARPVKRETTSTFKPPPSDSSYTYSSVPQSEDDDPTLTEQRFYNRKKNRPASSISEVLEEMERQRGNPDADPEDIETLGTRPLQSVAMETTPLTCDGIVLPPVEGTNVDNCQGAWDVHDQSSDLSTGEHHEDDVENDADNESDSPSPPPPAHVLHEYNGDSGYEAESKPDEEETLMIDSYHGTGSFQEEETPSEGVNDQCQVDMDDSPYLDSKNSNYVSENVTPSLKSETGSLGKESRSGSNSSAAEELPGKDSDKVINYGFPNTPVIDLNGPDFAPKKSSIVSNNMCDT